MFQIRDLMVDVLPGDAMRLFPCTCRVSADGEREPVPEGDPEPPRSPDPVPGCPGSVLPSADCVSAPDPEARQAADLSLLKAHLKRQLRGGLEPEAAASP